MPRTWATLHYPPRHRHSLALVVVLGVGGGTHKELLLYRNKMDYKYNPSGSQIKKRIPLLRGRITVQPLKCKEYEAAGSGKMERMWNFMVDESHDFGNEHLVKFASTNKQQVEGLHRQLRQCLR